MPLHDAHVDAAATMLSHYADFIARHADKRY